MIPRTASLSTSWRSFFPTARSLGFTAGDVDLVWGLGTLHCMTQQQPFSVANPKI
jgi:agmatine/peptidylarginine deiminase